MKPDNLEKILTEALEEFKKREFAHVPEESEINLTFSNEYIKKRDKITKNLSRYYWKLINTTAKKVAVIIICLIVAFSSLMTVDAFRESLVSFVYRIYETFGIIEAEKTQSQDIKRFYTIETPPEFTITYEIATRSFYDVSWEYNDLLITYTQSLGTSDSHFDTEHGEVKEEIINGTPCLTCESAGVYLCFWDFDGYRFELLYPKELGKEYLSKVVGKLIEFVPENIV